MSLPEVFPEVYSFTFVGTENYHVRLTNIRIAHKGDNESNIINNFLDFSYILIQPCSLSCTFTQPQQVFGLQRKTFAGKRLATTRTKCIVPDQTALLITLHKHSN